MKLRSVFLMSSLLSLSAFAEVIAPETISSVIDEAQRTSAGLSCEMKDLRSGYVRRVGASELGWDYLRETEGVTLSGESVGDEVRIFRRQQQTPTIVSELFATFKVNRDGTRVIGIEIKEDHFVTERVNVGTVARPRYETRPVKKPRSLIICK